MKRQDREGEHIHTTPSDRAHKQSHAFTWKMALQRALDAKLQRSINLARCNKDYQLKYPNECRDNPECKVLKECHPEAVKRILKEHQVILKKSIIPIIDRPARLNRVG